MWLKPAIISSDSNSDESIGHKRSKSTVDAMVRANTAEKVSKGKRSKSKLSNRENNKSKNNWATQWPGTRAR
jgi:ribosome assembly protein YihI (activator of Der GTPase)